MPKYYVQSGKVSSVLLAVDPQAAAMATINEALGKFIAQQEETEANFQWIDQFHINEVKSDFEEKIMVSEIGFGRSEAGEFKVDDMIQYWHQMIVALESLMQRLA